MSLKNGKRKTMTTKTNQIHVYISGLKKLEIVIEWGNGLGEDRSRQHRPTISKCYTRKYITP